MERAKQLSGTVIPSILNNDPVTPRVPILQNWTYSIIKERAFADNKYVSHGHSVPNSLLGNTERFNKKYLEPGTMLEN